MGDSMADSPNRISFTPPTTADISGVIIPKDWFSCSMSAARLISCWVIEGVPGNEKTKRQSGYSKRNFWVDKEYFLVRQIHFFSKRKGDQEAPHKKKYR